MDIRPGTLQDVSSVRALISALTVDRGDIVTTGFLEYPLPSEEELLQRCSDNPFFLVAAHGEEIVGFFVGYTNDRLARRADLHEAEQHILSISDHFVYGELIGVLPSFQHQGVAQQLHLQIFDRMREQEYFDFFGICAQAPLANFAARKLMERLALDFVTEISEADELIFRIYTKTL